MASVRHPCAAPRAGVDAVDEQARSRTVADGSQAQYRWIVEIVALCGGAVESFAPTANDPTHLCALGRNPTCGAR